MNLEPKDPNLLVELARPRPGLSSDVDVATCQILAALSDGQPLDAEPFRVLIERNRQLASAPGEVISDSLTRQNVVLEALWLHFAERAAREKRADHAALLMKASLGCQRALSGVLGTIHQLAEESRNANAIDAE